MKKNKKRVFKIKRRACVLIMTSERAERRCHPERVNEQKRWSRCIGLSNSQRRIKKYRHTLSANTQGI
jgi:hypothetical protein